MIFDPNNEQGARALERLANDRIGWLTAVRPDGQPVSMPIWFLWQDGEFVMYSDQHAKRNGHLSGTHGWRSTSPATSAGVTS